MNSSVGSSVGSEPASVGSRPAGRFLSQAAYARRVGVNPSTVTRWIQNGRITVRQDGRIDPEQADRERDATESPLPHHQARKAQIDAEKEAKARQEAAEEAAREPRGSEELGLALKRETYRLQKAKAEQANLELDKSAGLLVERSEVEFILRDIAAVVQGKLGGLSAQLAPALSAHRGDVAKIQADLDAYARDALSELAAHMERQAQQHFDDTHTRIMS